jgi:2',3'-cyclic-nucleotide 2'-phosphodiesterase
VQTADERILPGGTACLTDAGMTGAHDGVIGIDKDAIIARFRSGLPGRFENATGDPRLNGVVIAVDASSGRASSIARISHSEHELKEITDAVTAARA